MQQVVEHLDAALHDGVRGFAAYVTDETDPARVLLVAGIVEALRRGQSPPRAAMLARVRDPACLMDMRLISLAPPLELFVSGPPIVADPVWVAYQRATLRHLSTGRDWRPCAVPMANTVDEAPRAGVNRARRARPRLRGCTTRSERRMLGHPLARGLRQRGQHAVHPLGVADVDEQQGEDHEREGGHLQHLGGDALEARAAAPRSATAAGRRGRRRRPPAPGSRPRR